MFPRFFSLGLQDSVPSGISPLLIVIASGRENRGCFQCVERAGGPAKNKWV